ncbi:MAG: N-acetyl-gamma-glutamyl-phosphate reductase [Candidatus Puniceispirillaceae bacterium]
MSIQVFIDGQAGTTGLQVAEKLAHHSAISLITLDETQRKQASARQEAYAQADAAILCLPDDAAREAADMASDHKVVLIDASTAHRTDDSWVYGMAELSQTQRHDIASSRFISNPGCYPTGFLAMVAPLRAAGVLSQDVQLIVPAISGFSGGGKALIEAFSGSQTPRHFTYAHGLSHKHLPEMQKLASLDNAPIFMPSVGDFAQGMLVHLPLFATQLSKQISAKDIAEIFQAHYETSALITAYDANEMACHTENGFLAADGLKDTDRLEIFTSYQATSQQFWLTARLDNLGKGASGAAVQNMNIALGLDELLGLSV